MKILDRVPNRVMPRRARASRRTHRRRVRLALACGCLLSIALVVGTEDSLAQPPAALQAGDADQDLDFDQFDMILTLQSAKYLTGEPATWGEGDWNGAPGGSPGDPPVGNEIFDQLDLIAALKSERYATGPYGTGGLTPPDLLSPICGPRIEGGNQTSILYDAGTGELAISAPADTNLTSVNIYSKEGIFTGHPAQNLGGSFDIDTDHNIFKATLGDSFGSLSFGNVAQTGLSERFIRADLRVAGSLAGGGGLGDVTGPYLEGLPQLPSLLPGDANADLWFDQLDLVQVLQAAKYLTGEPATWGEGDWNGAPGGVPCRPPPGDGVFDQMDIVAALIPGHYLQGSYAAMQLAGDPYAAVPEPSSFLLLAAGLLGMLAYVLRRANR